MSEDYFPRALRITLGEEGGFSDNPADTGGRTQWGITQRVYSAWLANSGQPDADVATVTRAQAETLYRLLYWVRSHADALSERLACLQFDAAVNHGPANAVKLLQRALGIADDGAWGPATARAAQAAGDSVVDAYLTARQAFYDHIVDSNPSQQCFYRGWCNRLEDLRRALA